MRLLKLIRICRDGLRGTNQKFKKKVSGGLLTDLKSFRRLHIKSKKILTNGMKTRVMRIAQS